MAEETHSKEPEAPPAAEVVVAEEKSVVTETPAAPVVAEELKKPEGEVTATLVPETEETKPEVPEDAATAIPRSTSFKEESNVLADVVDPEKKALDEFKQLVQVALANNEFNPPPPPSAPAPAEEKAPVKEDEPAKPENATADAPPATEEPKAETDQSGSVKEPVPPPAVLEPEEPVAPAKEERLAPLLPVVEDKAVTVVDDGAKTVEAIKETVVPVADSAATPAPAATTEKAPPAAAAAVEEPLPETTAASPEVPPEPVLIWGVPLLGDERSDAVLLKFLRARELKAKDALVMLKNTVIWRKQFGIDALLDDDLGLPELEKAVFMHGVDREGHPVCYNVYGEFQDQELYEKAFGDEVKRQSFLKWRIQYLEKGIRELLDFSPGGVSAMVQVTDMKNLPRQGKHRQVANQAVALLQDNYPEFIATKVFINVSWWNLDYYRMKISSFFTQRTKSKFVFAGPSRSAEILFKYIAPEQVQVAYGGLSKENDPDFTTADAATVLTIKPSSKESIEIPADEGSQLVWELRVLGWEVSYGAEFVPSAEDGYTVIVQKTRKMAAADEPIITGSYKIGEPGKVVLTIQNPTSKKKKLLYRYKTKNFIESS